MTLASEYKRQRAWRDWPTIFNALPAVEGQTVLDLGCGVGDQAAGLAARGARVVGVDINEELLREAKSRGLPDAEFRNADLRNLSDLGAQFDGLWSSFTAAYFTDLPAALAMWTKQLRPSGWIALTEIDDLFGHEPVSPRTKSLFDAYARDALAADLYDFHMGRKLRDHLERAGFSVSKVFTVGDQEFSLTGPARPDVLEAWRNRLDRLKFLQDVCGSEFEQLKADFLGCLTRQDHRSTCKVWCCIAKK